jgi:hypothetical protein
MNTRKHQVTSVPSCLKVIAAIISLLISVRTAGNLEYNDKAGLLAISPKLFGYFMIIP